MSRMQIIWAILACLLIILSMVFWISFTPADSLASGIAHPNYPHMSYGGHGARAWPIFWPVYIWQLTALILAHLLILLSIPKSRHGQIAGWIILAFICAAGVWSMLMLHYYEFLKTGQTSMVLGFPRASSWLIYGVWLAPISLSALYCLGFERFIHTPADDAAFRALCERYSRS